MMKLLRVPTFLQRVIRNEVNVVFDVVPVQELLGSISDVRRRSV